MILITQKDIIYRCPIDTANSTIAIMSRDSRENIIKNITVLTNAYNVPYIKIVWTDETPLLPQDDILYLVNYRKGSYLIYNDDFDGLLQLGIPQIEPEVYNNNKTIKIYGE